MKTRVAFLCLVFALSACGGGGGGSPETTAAAPAPAPVLLAVSDFAPAGGVPGSLVTVNGKGLKSATEVRFANGTLAPLDAGHSDTSATFIVPAGAASGVLSFTGSYNQISTSTVYSVVAPISVSSVSSKVEGAALKILVQGSNLDIVSSARVGADSATIASRTASQILLSAPLGAQGSVRLASAYQDGVDAGAVGAQNFTLGSVDFAQVFSRNISDPDLRLTRGKPAVVRASVLAATAGIASPAVKLAVYSAGGAYLGALPMTGPATMPTVKDAARMAGTYNAVLPAAWVQPGVQTVVTAGNGGLFQRADPIISNTGKIKLVLVRLLTAQGFTRLPDLAQVKQALLRTYPYAANDITVTSRAQWLDVLDVPGSSRDFAWWEATLARLDTLRAQEDPSAYYYAIAPGGTDDDTVGLGYIGERIFGREFSSAMGVDANWNIAASQDAFGNAWPGWLSTLVHEVGHNHSLNHVACGAVKNAVSDYPYVDGKLNINLPLYDGAAGGDGIGAASAPEYLDGGLATTMRDVMSYCKGAWFSDYSYLRAQQFAEARNLSRPQALSGAAAPADGYLTIAGKISAGGVQLRPALASSARLGDEAVGAHHAYILRVLTVAGRTLDLPFDAAALGDAKEEVRHFRVSLANPGEIASVEVLPGARDLPRMARNKSGANAALTSAGVAASGAGPARLDWTLRNGQLALRWNAGAEPYVSVLYIAANGARTLLAPALTGGGASLDVRELPAGGRFEVSLSTSLKARLVSLPNK
ncbi:IPT/TIG domain-containing protein [Janthinobacterium sp.]|uniref:IPT/TIG domain-containing protein n=1 Tax=Janthinobacterium sp. TaxID=1871054 RepID=UPI00293D47E8|nr:IPT/TIG domain-containing protein [Janthinobacterium sp.]